MLKIVRLFIAVAMVAITGTGMAAVRPLSGTVIVNVTSDTAAAAKNKAMDNARRQIITTALSPYVATDALQASIAAASSAELATLIDTINIDGEQSSDTTYSANITMTVDRGIARAWLDEKQVQNWLTDGVGGDMFTINITLKNPITDWAAINKIARAENMELNTLSIVGKNIVATMPAANRTGFTIALRESGWRTADVDGILMLTK